MKQYIDKSAIIQYLTGMAESACCDENVKRIIKELIIPHINNLEVKDPYEQRIQYPSVKDGIESHAETYSFNIESELFNQLTKEQQRLWRKEIEQACISGGEAGVELARDLRYKENLEVKEVDFEKEAEYPFKKGDKVIIHCRAERYQDNVTFELFDNKMGTVRDIWELKRNPWGNIGVIIDGGYSDMFYVDELEPLPKGE